MREQIVNANRNNLMRDLGVIVFSVAIAITLAKSGILEGWLAGAGEWRFLRGFLAGMFFVSVFTAAPAAVALVEMAKHNPAWEVALAGGIGALAGDLLIFRFIKDSLAEDLRWLIRKTGRERLASIFRLKLFRWLVPFVGALIVASPLPDELGLAMMGLSKMRTAVFIPISFILNFLGILAIGLVAKEFL